MIRRCRAGVETQVLLEGDWRTFLLCGGSGAPVVLLHGAGGGGILWAPVLKSLAGHFHTIVPDIIGFGESAKPPADYGKRFFAAWLQRVLDGVGVDRVSLIGNSMGGSIAMQYALEHPQRIDKIILVGSAGLGFKGFSGTVLLAMAAAVLLPTASTTRRLARYLVACPDRLTDNEELAYLLAVARSAGARRQFLRGRGSVVRPYPSARLNTIQISTLLLWGEADRVMSIDNALRGLSCLHRATLRIIPDAGHVPYYDQPAEFCRHVIDFLK
jgi:pimeloyl-ACP methyl ester carboxylesterase